MKLSGGQGSGKERVAGVGGEAQGMFLAMDRWQRKADTTTTARPAAGKPAYARLFPLQPLRCIGLDNRLEFGETLVIGIQTFQIRIMHKPEQNLRWRHRTPLPQWRIDDGIERNQDIKLHEGDLGEVSGSMRREINPKALLQDSNRVRRGRTSSLRDPGTFRMDA